MSPRPAEPASDILLVDDDTEATEVLTDVLQAEGYRVRVAHDGREGLARVDEAYPAMVVLDAEMPVLSGPEMALQMFLEDLGREDIPVLLCSGALQLPRIAAQVGTPYYLPKPYELSALLKLVARVLLERIPPDRHRPTRST
jgi:CheY-like chemotaxis protein